MNNLGVQIRYRECENFGALRRCAEVSKRRVDRLYFRQRRFRGCYAPARLHRVPYPLRTTKCLRSSYHSAPRRVARKLTPPFLCPSRRSLNHTLFVPRRPRNTQSAQEKGVHRARNPPCLVLASLKISASHPLVCNRSFASTTTRPQIGRWIALREILV